MSQPHQGRATRFEGIRIIRVTRVHLLTHSRPLASRSVVWWNVFEPSDAYRQRPCMLNNSHIYHQTKHDLKKRGIEGTQCSPSSRYEAFIQPSIVSGVSLNLPQMLKAKDQSVVRLTKGIEILFKQNKVDYIKGSGSFVSPTRIAVQLLEGGETEIEAKNVIIATGSEVTPFPGGNIQIEEKQIVSSTGALELQEVPDKMVVIGGGIFQRVS